MSGPWVLFFIFIPAARSGNIFPGLCPQASLRLPSTFCCSWAGRGPFLSDLRRPARWDTVGRATPRRPDGFGSVPRRLTPKAARARLLGHLSRTSTSEGTAASRGNGPGAALAPRLPGSPTARTESPYTHTRSTRTSGPGLQGSNLHSAEHQRRDPAS